MARIFVSHSGKEGMHVKQLVSELRRADQNVFVDLDAYPGDDFEMQMREALLKADVFIVVFAGDTPEWTMSDIVGALNQARARPMLVLPILIGDSQVPPELKYKRALRIGDKRPPEYVKDVMLIIEAHEQSLTERAERKKEVERDLSTFVNEAVERQLLQEAKNRRAAHLWYAMGVMCLLLVLAVAIGSSFHVINNAPPPNSFVTPLMLAILNVVVVGVLAALARYAYSLGKSYMSESLKSADRIHAIQFGKFFLGAFGDKLTPEQVKDAFQHWNIDRSSTFSSLDPTHIDPQIYTLISQLFGVISSKSGK